ncbi:MAG: hypothetical protein KatS3mg003_0322 [Candidatus Nitrosocaldaceae archaeon]|nr:MAG: hypothetical protein KatS3mg003_0322 [Candidatus Nitrosocaldaceae archaeon]
MLTYYFITNKENIQLARDEAIALITAYNPNAEVISKDRLLIVNSNKDLKQVWDRAAMLRYAGRSYDKVDLKTFACKVINLTDNKLDQRYYIDKFVKEMNLKNAKVSLNNPDVVFGIIIADKEYRCILLRKNNKKLLKLHKHPAELVDKLAILMINLSGVIEDEILLDPCCGTGTIIMYASYMGINSIGCDISMKMCNYARDNLEINNLSASIINCDSTRLPIKRADVMVSNLPYGRASSTYKRDSKELIRRIIDECNMAKRVVIMCKEGDEPEYIKSYTIYVHSNLRRKIVICR